MTLDSWYIDNLVCPVDHKVLRVSGDSQLCCASGHEYPVIDGTPVMLPENIDPTIQSMGTARTTARNDAPWYLDSVLVSDEQKHGIKDLIANGSAVNPVAAFLVAATNGIAYQHLVGTLDSYPIPAIRLPPGNGKMLLDVGCSWGRWSISAFRNGYSVVGLDPSLGAVMAAKRVSAELGVDARFVVGDARHLPFRGGLFDQAFSYSVLQHLSFDDAAQSFEQIGRVLKPQGRSFIQMPTRFGLRCLYNQWQRGFRDTTGFEVRYWTIRDLLNVCGRTIGKSEYSVDCYFGIGWQPTDLAYMPLSYRAIVRSSEILRKVSPLFPPLKWVADSIYIQSTKHTKT